MRCRAATSRNSPGAAGAFANEVKSEISYVCGSTAIADTADRGFQIKEHQAAEKVVAPFKVLPSCL